MSGSRLSVSNMIMTNGALNLNCSDSLFQDLTLDRGALWLTGQQIRMQRMRQRWGEATLSGTNVTLLQSVVYTTNDLKNALAVNASGNIGVTNCTVVSANGTALAKTGAGTLRSGQNILVAGGTDANSVIQWVEGNMISDWNNLWARGSAWIGVRNEKWEKLAYWQLASGKEANSVSFDPLFQNEAAGDFHLNSIAGRWSPIFNSWDVDVVHSPVIDMGDPWIGTETEPMYNGYRRNLGAYGGTVQASKGRSNLWLTAMTMNDGGVLRGTNVMLRWAAGNASGKTVTLQYFNGTDWVDIATGVSAADGSYLWDSTSVTDCFDARWRVVAEDGSGVSDQTDATFALRNSPHAFYVNDAYIPGEDIYCSAAGNSASDGLSPATPKDSLQAILDTYDLEGGDIVYVDSGTYASASDIRFIWSRSGSTNATVVIQGNTNGAYTLFTRTGSTNYPVVGMDVKASHLELTHLAVHGMDRGILLESNRNVSVRGVVISEANTGLAVQGATGTDIRNSAFWRTGWGVHLINTRTSVMENLTFARSALAGIRMSNTVLDTIQNNIFIPEAGAYAFSIGSVTSLLENAVLDYNLYDFGQEGSGFYEGDTNVILRTWQNAHHKDYRSAITSADLQDVVYDGDFHPKSAFGRWTSTGWVDDEVTSWAVDHGHPLQDSDTEPEPNGGRLNIGMYGNTVQASMGDTNISLDVRTVNEPGLVITAEDPIWPMIWSAHLVDGAEWVLVQFSGDSGETWMTLTNTSAYAEYYVWQAAPEFQTAHGRWRVIGVTDTNLVGMSQHDFDVDWLPFKPIRVYPVSGLMRMDWQGGVQGLDYRIEYSDDFGQTWQTWEDKYNGPAQINKSRFTIPVGESKLRYTFEDRTSYLRRTRWYRIFKIQD